MKAHVVKSDDRVKQRKRHGIWYNIHNKITYFMMKAAVITMVTGTLSTSIKVPVYAAEIEVSSNN